MSSDVQVRPFWILVLIVGAALTAIASAAFDAQTRSIATAARVDGLIGRLDRIDKMLDRFDTKLDKIAKDIAERGSW